MDERLKGIFKDTLNLNNETLNIDETSSINTVPGWDSLGHVKLIIALEREYGIQIETMEAIELTDVPSIQKLLEKKLINK